MDQSQILSYAVGAATVAFAVYTFAETHKYELIAGAVAVAGLYGAFRNTSVGTRGNDLAKSLLQRGQSATLQQVAELDSLRIHLLSILINGAVLYGKARSGIALGLLLSSTLFIFYAEG